jgi:hypothetical protein
VPCRAHNAEVELATLYELRSYHLAHAGRLERATERLVRGHKAKAERLTEEIERRTA